MLSQRSAQAILWNMKVPLLDLSAQFRTVEADLRQAIDGVLESQQYVLGPETQALEAEIADFCGVQHAVGVSNGSDAIVAALGGVEATALDSVGAETGALEALRMAIKAEESAHRFYAMAVERTTDPEAKHVFSDLAKEEERHRTVVQDEYNRLTMDPDWDRYGIWREVL